MRISRIYIRNDNSLHLVNSVFLLEGIGIKDNSPSKDEDKQISIFSEEGRKEIDNLVEHGLCTKKFQEDITIEDLIISDLSPGEKLVMGKVVIEITMVGKRCYGDCPLISTKSFCPLRRGIVFGKVLEGGQIETGNIVIKD
ncbi:MAG TPA: hypothetical protein GXZ78_05990 [Eubacteriaceae bacterium]|nr:hypothetical protein [Eubacteriaceae bacterium]